MQEGTNPVVLRSKDERKKLISGEKRKVRSGDIIELIPGHYFFKYAPVTNNREKKPLNEESSKGKGFTHTGKRVQNIPDEEALVSDSNVMFLGFL